MLYAYLAFNRCKVSRSSLNYLRSIWHFFRALSSGMWSRLQICNEIRLCVAKIKHRSIQLQIAPTNLLLWAVAFVNVRSNSSIRKIPVFWWIQIRFGASTLEITVYKLGMLGSGRKIKFGRGPWSVFVRKEADHGGRGSLSLENTHTHAHKTKQNKTKTKIISWL